MSSKAARTRGSVAAGISVTDDSAFKRQVRDRMAQTGEKYTVARRMVIADHDRGKPPVVLRVYLNPHVDLELTAEAGRAYAAADEQGNQQSRIDAEAARDAAIRGAVQRSLERAVGLPAVEVDLAADRVHVTIRAERPGGARPAGDTGQRYVRASGLRPQNPGHGYACASAGSQTRLRPPSELADDRHR